MDRKVASTENDVAPINLPRQRPSRIGSLLLVSLVATVYLFIKGSVTLRSNELVATSFPLQVNADDFDWDTIEPSSALKWVPCYERFECARLSVRHIRPPHLTMLRDCLKLEGAIGLLRT
jgi:hypothetical protein